MTKKKSILIVAIIAVLVVAISGVSFAAWATFVKPADQTWTVTANTPAQLKVNTLSSTTPVNYNGEPAYTTVQTVNVTATLGMTMTASVVVTVDLAGTPGSTYEAIDGTATVALGDAVLVANTAKDVTITVTFPDLSAPKYYGATFKIAVTLDKLA